MESSVETVCSLLSRTKLLATEDVQELHKKWMAEAGDKGSDASQLARWLVANHYLTGYQAERILRGQTDHYFFNEYKILDRIGQGRMAGIYKAVHRLGHTVAIKVLPPSKAKDEQAFGRFKREARLALRLKHPNVVRTFQTGEAAKLHYLVMEYLDGETLEEALKRRKKLAPQEAARLIHQALQGLQHLHDQNMIHRDLKPANLMLVPAPAPRAEDTTEGGTLKILDIGVGRALFDEGATESQRDLTNQGDLLGSPDYMAPEQARNAHAADIRSDIYGLGCVLYHTLAGQPPFPADNPVKIILRHSTETPRPLKEFSPVIPDGLQQIVSRMLAKDPAQRFQTPDQAARAVQSFLEGGGPKGREPARAAMDSRELSDYESRLETEDPEVAEIVKLRVRSPGKTAARGGTWHKDSTKVLVGAGVGACALIALVAIFFVFNPPGKEGKLNPKAPKDSASTKDTKKGGDKTAKKAAETIEELEKRVAGLKPADQVEAVVMRLKDLNPGFDGKFVHKVQGDQVTELQFGADGLTNIAPVRALKGLKRLACTGSQPGKGKLADLSPLRGLELAVADFSSTQVSDLTPLQGMPLVFLSVSGTQVRDLSPVKDLPLMVVNCAGTSVKDLSPLQAMDLTLLDAAGCPVDDLAPLRGMPLGALWCSFQPERDGAVLRTLTTLKEINGKPASAVWKDLANQQKTFDGWVKTVADLPPAAQIEEVMKKLKDLNPGFDGKYKVKPPAGPVVELQLLSDAITDFSPLRALTKLQRLYCHGSGPGKGQLASLQPLKGLRLVELDCSQSKVNDLTPLQGMPLTTLNLNGNARVHDLNPIKGLPLTWLNIGATQVKDLTPLKGKGLQYLFVHDTPVADLAPLRGMALKGLTCDLRPTHDPEVLRSLKSLEQLNNRPAAEYWKKVDAFDAWVKQVAKKPAKEQVKEVEAALKERNPGFNGPVTPTIVSNVVTELNFRTDLVEDLTPLRALPGLVKLYSSGTARGKGKLADLGPLKGLKLKTLSIRYNQVTDLALLKSMPLQELWCDFERERDGDVLQAMASLKRINDKPAAKFLNPDAAPAPVRGKPIPAASFRGEVVRVNISNRTLTVRLKQAVLLVNSGHAGWLYHHQVRLLQAPRIRNPIERMRFIQEHMVWIAHHRAHLYYWQKQHKDLELQATAEAKVYTGIKPIFYDDKGNVRKPTKEELAKITGPGKTYISAFNNLRNHQLVEVLISRVDTRPPDKETKGPPPPGDEDKPAAPPLQVTRVIILQEGL